MDDPIKRVDEIEQAEFRESVKQALMRLLDDPQVQQKLSSWFRSGCGLDS